MHSACHVSSIADAALDEVLSTGRNRLGGRTSQPRVRIAGEDDYPELREESADGGRGVDARRPFPEIDVGDEGIGHNRTRQAHRDTRLSALADNLEALLAKGGSKAGAQEALVLEQQHAHERSMATASASTSAVPRMALLSWRGDRVDAGAIPLLCLRGRRPGEASRTAIGLVAYMPRFSRVLSIALVACSLVVSPVAMNEASAITEPTFWAWGENSSGQLGLGNTVGPQTSPQAVAVPSGVSFVSLAAGEGHSCGLTASGAAYCWGHNGFGQLGLGNTVGPQTSPQAVVMPSGVSFVSLAAGGGHSCGLTPAGAAYCWGYNGSGRLGLGNTTDASSPQAVMMPSEVTFGSLTAGTYHTCGLTPAGAAYCWGHNGFGQLGLGNTVGPQTSPQAVVMPSGVTFGSLTAGRYHSCGLTSAGAAYCWGYNGLGQLGDGTRVDASSPQAVVMPSGVLFASLTAGLYHTCGLTRAGAAYCWGFNGSGQLGLGTTASPQTLPQPVIGGPVLSALVSGSSGFSTFGLPLRAASGSEVPRAALQQFARAESGLCDVQPDDLVDFPALAGVRHQAWGPSWAQWPNGGTGGFVCSRQPYYTSIDTWAVE